MKKDKKFFQGHERLAEERARLWGTQQDAADFFGVSRVTWGQYERGNATPTGDVLAGLAQQGADVLYIITGQRNPNLDDPRPTPPKYEAPPDEEWLLDAYRYSSDEVKAVIMGATKAAALAARGSMPAKIRRKTS